MSRRAGVPLLLTHRALADIESIIEYSREQWGGRAGERYAKEIEAGLSRVKSRPELLHSQADLHSSLRFYRVKQHLLVCDARPDSIVVLTVVHASMDIPGRLAELEPTLAEEVNFLHQRLERES